MRDGGSGRLNLTSEIDPGAAEHAELLKSFVRHLQASAKSPATVAAYRYGLRAAWEYFARQGMPVRPAHVRREHIESFILDQLATKSDQTARLYFLGLRRYFGWLLEEGEITTHPMARMKVPKLAEKLPPVLTDAHLKQLLAACSGRDFLARRDAAILRLFLDTGMRRAELAGLTVADVDLDAQVALVHAKGNRQRLCHFGMKTAQALDRYLRVRRTHPQSGLPAFWLTRDGVLTGSGIYAMVKLRAKQAGLPPNLHPHLFRHYFASAWLELGGQEGDLMELGGWRSSEVMKKYGAAERSRRAMIAHEKLAPGDRF